MSANPTKREEILQFQALTVSAKIAKQFMLMQESQFDNRTMDVLGFVVKGAMHDDSMPFVLVHSIPHDAFYVIRVDNVGMFLRTHNVAHSIPQIFVK
jgi:hypothetical protein